MISSFRFFALMFFCVALAELDVEPVKRDRVNDVQIGEAAGGAGRDKGKAEEEEDEEGESLFAKMLHKITKRNEKTQNINHAEDEIMLEYLLEILHEETEENGDLPKPAQDGQEKGDIVKHEPNGKGDNVEPKDDARALKKGVSAPKDSDDKKDGSAQRKDKGDQIVLKLMVVNPPQNGVLQRRNEEKVDKTDEQGKLLVEHLNQIQKSLGEVTDNMSKMASETRQMGFAFFAIVMTMAGCVFVMLITNVFTKKKLKQTRKKRIVLNVSTSGVVKNEGQGQVANKGAKQKQGDTRIIIDEEDGAHAEDGPRGLVQSSRSTPSDDTVTGGSEVGGQPQAQHKSVVSPGRMVTQQSGSRKPMVGLMPQMMAQSGQQEQQVSSRNVHDQPRMPVRVHAPQVCGTVDGQGRYDANAPSPSVHFM